MSYKKRKINKNLIIVILIIIALGITGGYIIKTVNYHKTYTYKLQKLGYTEQEKKYFTRKKKKPTMNLILTLKYNKNIYDLSKKKYFLEKNLKTYLDYY